MKRLVLFMLLAGGPLWPRATLAASATVRTGALEVPADCALVAEEPEEGADQWTAGGW